MCDTNRNILMMLYALLSIHSHEFYVFDAVVDILLPRLRQWLLHLLVRSPELREAVGWLEVRKSSYRKAILAEDLQHWRRLGVARFRTPTDSIYCGNAYPNMQYRPLRTQANNMSLVEILITALVCYVVGSTTSARSLLC